MAQKPETVFRQRIRPFLDALPNTAVFAIQQKTIKGDPDFILCINGLFCALELKAEDGKTTALQEYKLDKVANSKGLAFVADPDNWDDIYAILKEAACADVEGINQQWRRQ